MSPAIGVATALRPGTNFATTSVPIPYRLNEPVVRSTQVSGSSEMWQSKRSTL